MTTIDRTAYPRFKRALSERDLTEVYTLTEDEHELVNRSTWGSYGIRQKFPQVS